MEEAENKTEHMEKTEPIPRDISVDYERIMAEPYGFAVWHDFLRSLRKEPYLLLKIDLSNESDQDIFVRKANFMKAFRQGGSSKLDKAEYEGKLPIRVAIIRCTSQQYNGADPKGIKTSGWAANAFASGVEWEETK